MGLPCVCYFRALLLNSVSMLPLTSNAPFILILPVVPSTQGPLWSLGHNPGPHDAHDHELLCSFKLYLCDVFHLRQLQQTWYRHVT